MKQLEGKVAFISGAGGGMGRAAALSFAKEGAKIALVDIRQALMADTLSAIQDQGGTAIAVEMDLADEASVQQAIDQCIRKLGGLDILLNFGGITQNRKFEEMSVQEWDRIISINLRGSFLTSHAAFLHMCKNGGGNIVNVSSAAVYSGGGHIGTAHYTASKAGVIGLTKAIAKEGAKYGIRCNAICPGLTQTGMTEAFLSTAKEENERIIPLGRVGTPKDMADAALFLASEQSSYITGTTLDVNGGLNMR